MDYICGSLQNTNIYWSVENTLLNQTVPSFLIGRSTTFGLATIQTHALLVTQLLTGTFL